MTTIRAECALYPENPLLNEPCAKEGKDGNTFIPAIHPTLPKIPLWRAMAFAGGLVLGMLSNSVHAAPSSGGDTVQGLYDALLNTMKNGRTLGQSGRFTQLDPVIHRSFDIALMARLAIGPSWASLTQAQRRQVTESFGRYISAIYAEHFDSYAGQKLEVTGERQSQ
jgi:ABC-type transporter MlaC component